MKENREEAGLVINTIGSFCSWNANLSWVNLISIHRSRIEGDQWSIDKRGKIIGDEDERKYE